MGITERYNELKKDKLELQGLLNEAQKKVINLRSQIKDIDKRILHMAFEHMTRERVVKLINDLQVCDIPDAHVTKIMSCGEKWRKAGKVDKNLEFLFEAIIYTEESLKDESPSKKKNNKAPRNFVGMLMEEDNEIENS